MTAPIVWPALPTMSDVQNLFGVVSGDCSLREYALIWYGIKKKPGATPIKEMIVAIVDTKCDISSNNNIVCLLQLGREKEASARVLVPPIRKRKPRDPMAAKLRLW